jgi:DNA-binding response OmpR family regulator
MITTRDGVKVRVRGLDSDADEYLVVVVEERLYGWDASMQSNAIELLIHGQRRKLGSTILENVRAMRWRMGHAA